MLLIDRAGKLEKQDSALQAPGQVHLTSLPNAVIPIIVAYRIFRVLRDARVARRETLSLYL
jgi:hypothetical protein